MNYWAWSLVLENSFLQLGWTTEAKIYTYTERQFRPVYIEDDQRCTSDLPDRAHDKQETLTKNDKHYSDARTHKDRFIANFTYYDDSNALVINFTEEPRELCEDATKYLLVYYNDTDKIKSIRIDDPPKFIRGIASEKPSFALNPTYDEKRDVFKLNFADSVSTTFQETNVEDVEIEIDEEGKLVTILFRNASIKMANMLK